MSPFKQVSSVIKRELVPKKRDVIILKKREMKKRDKWHKLLEERLGMAKAHQLIDEMRQ